MNTSESLIETVEKMREQLNQAMEVLEWYANNEFWKTEVINVEDVNYKARSFLSSLSQETRESI